MGANWLHGVSKGGGVTGCRYPWTMDEQPSIPRLAMPTETLIIEEEGEPLFWINGLLALPIGSRINLDNRGIEGAVLVPVDAERFQSQVVDAVVVGVEVRDTQHQSRFLALIVELTNPGEAAFALKSSMDTTSM